MKNIFVFSILLLFPFIMFSQKTTVSIKKIITDDKIFKGSIGENPITIYLKLSNYSEGHSRIYSVKGWYYYNKYKKKISLVGLYDQDFTLYVFDDKNIEKEFLKFSCEENQNFWKYIDSYKTRKRFKEKFIYSSMNEEYYKK